MGHRHQPVVVIGASPRRDHLATLVRPRTPHVRVVTAPEAVELVGDGTNLSHVMLRDGRTLAATAPFVKAPIVPRSSIARAFGCDVDDKGDIVTSKRDLAELEKEIRTEKFTLAELDEEEQNVDRLRRWHRELCSRDVFDSVDEEEIAARLDGCAAALEHFTALVYNAVGLD